jgi:hypothetical protein
MSTATLSSRKSEKGARTFGQLLAEVRTLRGKGMGFLYERVVLLCQVYQDPEFRSHCENLEKNLEEELDAYLDDTCTDFLTARAVLKANPDKTDWLDKKLSAMKVEVLEAEQAGHAGKTAGTERFSYKAAWEELKREFEKLTIKYATLQENYDKLLAKVGSASGG